MLDPPPFSPIFSPPPLCTSFQAGPPLTTETTKRLSANIVNFIANCPSLHRPEFILKFREFTMINPRQFVRHRTQRTQRFPWKLSRKSQTVIYKLQSQSVTNVEISGDLNCECTNVIFLLLTLICWSRVVTQRYRSKERLIEINAANNEEKLQNTISLQDQDFKRRFVCK